MDLFLADKTTSKKRAPLMDAQKKYRFDNNLCLYYGAEGHFASQCPHSKKKKLNAAETATPAPLVELSKN